MSRDERQVGITLRNQGSMSDTTWGDIRKTFTTNETNCTSGEQRSGKLWIRRKV